MRAWFVVLGLIPWGAASAAGLIEAGQAALDRGDAAGAVAIFEDAMTTGRCAPDCAAAAVGLASGHWRAGDAAAARRALGAHEDRLAAADPAVRAAADNLAGILAEATGDFPRAFDHYAAGAVRAEGAAKAVLEVNAGRLALDLGLKDRALEHAGRARAHVVAAPAETRLALGDLLAALGEVEASYAAYEAVRRAAMDAGEDGQAAAALTAQADLYLTAKRPGEALILIDRALSGLLAASDASALAEIHARRGDAFRHQDRFQDGERAYAAAAAALGLLRQADPVRFRDLSARIYLGLADVRLRRAEIAEDEETRTRLLRAARDASEELKNAELQDYFNNVCVAGVSDQTADPDAPGPGVAVLYPIILPDRIALIASANGAVMAAETAIPAQRLARDLLNFRRRLESFRDPRFLIQARQLHDLLIAPVEAFLRAQETSMLIVAPSGGLRSIPFAALHDGERFLIERYAVAVTPSLASLPAPRDRLTAPSLVVGAVSDGVQGFAPLPGVANEVSSLAMITRPDVFFNDAFDPRPLREALSNDLYDFVHIASHGEFGGSYGESYLLTYTDRVTLEDLDGLIRSTRPPDRPIDLLALSACSTADGDDRAALGLAGVALKAGARSALASLWKVSDAAATRLIERFYAEYLSGRSSKPEALRQAQLALIADPALAHPGYWSPFLLIGAVD